LNEARSLLAHANTAVTTAQLCERGRLGAVSLGFTALGAVWLIPRLIKLARSEYPDISLVLREMLSSDQMNRLVTGQLDIGILRPLASRPELESVPIHCEQLLLAVHRNDKLAQRRRLSIRDLHGHPFIMYSPDDARSFYDLLSGLFRQAGIVPDVVQHVGMPYAVLAMVDAELGVALVPESARRFAPREVVFLPIALPDRAAIELHLAWRKANDNPALPLVLQSIRGLSEPDHAMQHLDRKSQ
jgi:DNA-binding transcriptional LysR family regulator